MAAKFLLVLLIVAKASALPQNQATSYQEKYNTLKTTLRDSARFMLKNIDEDTTNTAREYQRADWSYQTNLNPRTSKDQVDAALDYSRSYQQARAQVESWKDLAEPVSDPIIKRQFTLLSRPQTIELPEKEMRKYYEVLAKMKEDYSTATVCKDVSCNLNANPDLEEQFRTNRNVDELKKLWLGFRYSAARTARPHFENLVELSNKGAVNVGYKDQGQMWRVPYESSNFKGDVKQVYDEFLPLYQQLHAYTRGKLRKYYGESNIPTKGPIPAHVFGDLWAEDWTNIYDIVEPYPAQPQLDVTDSLENQGYNAERVYRSADDYFQSMDLQRAPDSFWRNSVFSKPLDRPMDCKTELFDFASKDDYRVKECRKPSLRQLFDAYSEMGRLQYFLQYQDQPETFRRPANPGFGKAIGSTLALSATHPQRLYDQSLIESPELNGEQSINFLMLQALRTLPAMPYAYALDSWRWDIFEDKTSYNDLNCKWIEKRFNLQGVKPSVKRSEEDFDAGAKLETLGEDDYIQNFASRVLQFQMFKSLCEKAGEYREGTTATPLHQCNLYQSKPAGQEFAKMMQLGASKPWREALFSLTGEKEMSSAALREYFSPLQEWLTKENEKNSEFVGWERDDVYCEKEPVNPNQRSSIPCVYVKTRDGVQCM